MLSHEGRELPSPLVGAVAVVVAGVGVEYPPGLSRVPDQQVVEHSAPQSPDDPFAVAVLGPRLLPAQTSRGQDPQRSRALPERRLADVVYRTMIQDTATSLLPKP
jgi:hypothetical protein